MYHLIIGNLISLIASVFLAISNCASDKKTIYRFQFLETATYCISSVFFISWSGLSTLIISLIRNYLVMKGYFKEWQVYVFSALVILTGLYVNNRGLLGLIPIVATVEITFCNYYAQKVKVIKAGVLINTILWGIYSFLIFDIASGISQTIITVLGIVSLKKLK